MQQFDTTTTWPRLWRKWGDQLFHSLGKKKEEGGGSIQ